MSDEEEVIIIVSADEMRKWRESGHLYITDDMIQPDGSMKIELSAYVLIKAMLENAE